MKLNRAEEKSAQVFYTEFLENHSMGFLSLIIGQLLQTQNFVPEKFALSGLRFLYHAIKIKPTFTFLQPELLRILIELSLPYLRLTAADLALFVEDGEEYVRKQENYFFNSATQAQDLITLVCQKQDQ